MWPAMQSTKCSEDRACGTAWRGPATYSHGNFIPRRSTLWWTFSRISPSYEYDGCLKDSFFTPIVARRGAAVQVLLCCSWCQNTTACLAEVCTFSDGTWPGLLISEANSLNGYFSSSSFNGDFCWCRTVATAKRNEPVRLTEKCSVLLWNWCLIPYVPEMSQKKFGAPEMSQFVWLRC